MTKTWAETSRHIAAYYEKLIDQHGHSPLACDYGRASSQAKKFEVLTEPFQLDGAKILDVGCGFADFADFIGQRFSRFEYEGVDLSPRMIEEAKSLHPTLHLECLDILEARFDKSYDLVTANGIFYLLGDNAERTMMQLIERLFELSGDAVAFNSLSKWAPQQEPGEFYADPVKTLDFCKSLTTRVALRHDYMPHDFTVYLYK